MIKTEKNWNRRYYKWNFRSLLLPYISRSKRHLDFGCGFGFLTYILAKEYPRTMFYGIDIDKERIKIGRKRYSRVNLKLRCSNKIIGKFDSMSMCFVIHHLGNMTKQYLKELYKHLNPNGKIIVFDFRKVSKSRYKKWYDKKVKEGEYEDSFEKSYQTHNRWTIKEFSSLMEKIGFKTILTKPIGDLRFLYVGEK
ncbi:MAG: methyltransferase domain-containing protein [Candidatus Nanoarchaeia archaeon]|nr:class I SAM-dependent methyltransferase [Candidatus Jingweiarchaeum tengchongense]